MTDLGEDGEGGGVGEGNERVAAFPHELLLLVVLFGFLEVSGGGRRVYKPSVPTST